VVLAPDRSVEPEHLPLHLQDARPGPLPVGTDEGLAAGKARLVREFERRAVMRFLRDSGGNVSAAARLARITRRNFHRLLLKHGINPRDFRDGTPRSQHETF